VLSRRIELADKAFERTADEDADVAEAALRAHQLLRGQGAPHSHYYPLGTGSAWHYSGNHNQLLETVVGNETDSLGVTRFRFSRFRWMENVLLRFSGDDKVYLSKNGNETLLLDFAAKVGQEWTASDPESLSAQLRVRLESVSDSVKVPAGTFRNAYRFSFFGGMDNEWVEWYAPFVGPVKKHFNGIAFWEYNLDAYTIQTAAPPLGSAFPQAARLMQNYPNPVTGRAIIPFHVADARAHVRIAVHDLLGREVMILLDEECSFGVNIAAFDANGLPGGTYAVRLQSGAFSTLRLLTIVK